MPGESGEGGSRKKLIIGAAVAINLVLYGLGGPFAAGLYDRFGIRRVIVIALATIAISSASRYRPPAPGASL